MACPPRASSPNQHSLCVCDDGWRSDAVDRAGNNGKGAYLEAEWDEERQLWRHNCTRARCPPNTQGPAHRCECLSGYVWQGPHGVPKGKPTWDRAKGRWTHGCR